MLARSRVEEGELVERPNWDRLVIIVIIVVMIEKRILQLVWEVLDICREEGNTDVKSREQVQREEQI